MIKLIENKILTGVIIVKDTLKTACCYNCKYLDEDDEIKGISIPKYNCKLLKSYKYKYARCDEHVERIPGTVIKNNSIN